MKKIFLFFALVVGGFSTVATAADTFDPATNTLTLDSVTTGGVKYPNVVVRLNQFTVLGVGNSAPVEDEINETCEAGDLTRDKFGAIQEGMSIEQVTQILGCKYEKQIDINSDSRFSFDWTEPGGFVFGITFVESAPTKLIVDQSFSGRVLKILVNLGGSPLTGTTGTTNNVFDPTTNVLTMDSVWVTGGLKYENVAIHLGQSTVLGVAGETVVPPPPPPPITPPPPPLVSSFCSSANFTIDKYNAIQVGMSLDQVNQIIGCEANDIVRQGSLVTYAWNYVSGGTAKLIMVFFDQSSLNVTGSMDDFFKSSGGF